MTGPETSVGTCLDTYLGREGRLWWNVSGHVFADICEGRVACAENMSGDVC